MTDKTKKAAAKSRRKTKPYGYIYRTTATTSKATYYYIGKKHSPVFVSNYYGSGTVVLNVRKYSGEAALSVEPIAWAASLAELNELERCHIAECRAVWGKRCVNIMDGGDGHTSESAKRANANPITKAKISAAAKESNADPVTKAKISANNGMKSEETRAKVSASVSAAMLANPDRNPMTREEVRAKVSATMLANPDRNPMTREEVRDKFRGDRNPMKNPEVRAASRAKTQATFAATLPLRTEWQTLRPRLIAAGVQPPHVRPGSGVASWQKAIDDARRLLKSVA